MEEAQLSRDCLVLLQNIDKMLIVTSNSHKASDKAIKPKLYWVHDIQRNSHHTMVIDIENQYPPSTKRNDSYKTNTNTAITVDIPSYFLSQSHREIYTLLHLTFDD